MSNRILSPAVALGCLALLLMAAGCGRTQSSVGPTDSIRSSTSRADAAALARLETADAREDGKEDDNDDSWRSRATLITAPTVITSPGDYRLAADLDVKEGDGIVIRANDVRVWLGERTLRGPGNKSGRAIVLDGVQRVVVRGGHIERFGFGAVLMGSSDCRVRGLAVRGGDETADPANGNPPQIGLMLVNSAHNRIRNNQLSGVNLGIFVRGAGSYENVIRGNEVTAGQNGLLGICYNPAPGGDAAGPMRDRVSRNTLARFGTGISVSAGSMENRFIANSIGYFNSPYEDLNGTNVFERNTSKRLVR